VFKSASNKSQTPDKETPQPRLISSNEHLEMIFRFGPFELDPAERVLRKDEKPLSLTPKAFDILLLLVKDHGRLVSKDRLIDNIWPDTFVDEKTLTQNIFTIRKSLGPRDTGQHYIETVPKHGYRFGADVEIVPREAHSQLAAERLEGSLGILESDTSVSVSGKAERSESERNHFDRHALSTAPSSSGVAIDRPSESHSEVQAEKTGNSRKLIVFGFIALLVIAASLGVKKLYFRSNTLADTAFQRINISRLTNGADISALALAPSGNCVAFASKRGDMQSLVVRQVDTSSALEVVPPAAVGYRGITFSRDGAWIYYVTVEPDSFTGTLNRIPLLGGTPQKVLSESVDSRIELSPDGKQIAFVHWTDRLHTALMIANIDGSAERQLANLDYDDGFSIDGPAWSPDGKTILAATQSYNGRRTYAHIVAINVQDGKTQRFLGDKWNWIGELTWLSDGSGVVLTAWSTYSEVMSDQIWLMNYPDGETRRITNDVNGYLGVGLSSDAGAIAASESIPSKNFWVTPRDKWADAQKITNGPGELYSERLGATWTPNGEIVYSSRQGGGAQIWRMQSDGTQQKQLTFYKGSAIQPAVSPDGRYIVYVSFQEDGNRLWRIDADGSHPQPFAGTDGARSPTFSADGQSVIYETTDRGNNYLMRVTANGGDPARLSNIPAMFPAVSPDGRFVACLTAADTPGPAKLTLLSTSDGQIVRQFETLVPRNTPGLRWSGDGSSINYVMTRQGVSNIWNQPVSGGSPKAITDWKSDIIYRFDLSKDGRLLCERGNTVSDIILIRDTKMVKHL
jgi:Tol biopolymer transport system component/DNA-binding winged helix-turn-helix (wHTH) protein